MKIDRKIFESKSMQKKLLKIAGVLVVIVGLLGAYTYARYLTVNTSDDYVGTPKNFYFESDYLTVNHQTHSMQNWNTDRDYSFVIDIRNFQDTLRASTSDIEYKLNISELAENKITAKVNGAEVSDSARFTLGADQANTDQLVITVSSGFRPSSNKITVEATAVNNSSNTFTKTISATFTLVENTSSYDLVLENHRDYYDLLIGTAKSGNTITVTWPSWLAPDSTVEELKNAGATTGNYTTTKNDSSARLRFFVSGTVNKDDVIKVTDSSNIEKTIKISEAK